MKRAKPKPSWIISLLHWVMKTGIKEQVQIVNIVLKTKKRKLPLLPHSPVNVIREDPYKKNILYCGTDIGVYISNSGGNKWIPLNNNLPGVVSVQDLFIHPKTNQLVIATYGRGIFVLDDISLLQK